MQITETPLELVAGDIVNNCNLRCPFCLTDYANVRRTTSMPDETFASAMRLAKLVPDGAFWLSCMHEPTLHGNFHKYITQIPSEDRIKYSFTTNLAKPLSDELLEAIAFSEFHSIRLSIDSRDKQLFESLRKGSRYERFLENLDRLVKFLSAAPNPPKMHIISMAFRSNYEEMQDLVNWCSDYIGSDLHEIRYMYYLPHVADWGADHILPLAQWEKLKADLLSSPMGGKLAFGDPESNVMEQFSAKPGVDDYVSLPAVFGGTCTRDDYVQQDPVSKQVKFVDKPLRLRLRWDGLIMAEEIAEDDFRINILDIEDVSAYFDRLRTYAGSIGE